MKGGAEAPAIPEYLRKFYWWAYLHPRGVRIFERQWIVNLILWGNFRRLRDNALDQLGGTISGRTLQVACVYGDFTNRITDRLAPDARLDVIDVAPIQLDNLKRKLGDNSKVFIDLQDSASLTYEANTFDQIVVFFLLHEMPAHLRKRTVSEVLRVLKPGGKVIFMDYHRPARYNPHRYLMWPVLKLIEPFALDLWHTGLAELVDGDMHEYEKRTYFGESYQQFVVTHG